MFNTDLPSGRRRLFVLILFVFIVAGFSVKYLLIHLGWVGDGGNTEVGAKAENSKNMVPVNEPDIPALSQEEIQRVQITARAFVRAYVTRTSADYDGWLRSLKPYVTDQLFSLLEEEANYFESGGQTPTSRFKQLGRINCQDDLGKVGCLAEMVVEQDENGKKIPIERVYQLTLIKEKGEWLIEEVEVRGSFD
ncbi:hypothetical protein [Thermoactinomyces mirandus]|uniref:Uncharacterized protein n=1 Tax=Thermoactinomyces mirandus TaxID=2756294 RepID=A0A7W1XV18_9BACL|nr:hypothetical protein [Thermoactinomyces mirandus]MBA4603780.1 hypothetical protein [Thermoactinomyces mirandus]